MSRVMCHVSHVTFFLFLFGQFGEAYRWRVCYQRGLPRLVFKERLPGGGQGEEVQALQGGAG